MGSVLPGSWRSTYFSLSKGFNLDLTIMETRFHFFLVILNWSLDVEIVQIINSLLSSVLRSLPFNVSDRRF